MKKLIIFDCDGVLVDSEIVAHKAGIDVFKEHGYDLSLEESIKIFTGMNSNSIHDYVLSKSGIDIPMNVMEFAVLSALEKDVTALMFPVLSHDTLFNNSICVASSSKRERVLSSLKITQQLRFFKEENIFTAAQVKNGKPAPDLFLFAADQMGHRPKDCLVIEDSIAGIHAAKAAGMSVVGFLGGSHASFAWYAQRVINENIDVAHNHDQLLALIANFNSF